MTEDEAKRYVCELAHFVTEELDKVPAGFRDRSYTAFTSAIVGLAVSEANDPARMAATLSVVMTLAVEVGADPDKNPDSLLRKAEQVLTEEFGKHGPT